MRAGEHLPQLRLEAHAEPFPGLPGRRRQSWGDLRLPAQTSPQRLFSAGVAARPVCPDPAATCDLR